MHKALPRKRYEYGGLTISPLRGYGPGDTAILRNQHGTTIDSCAYKGTSQGYVFC